MTTKADMKRLLSKGFTGKEAGRLIFHDNWLADTGRGGFLSEKDVSSLKAGLKGDKDIKEYNLYPALQVCRLHAQGSQDSSSGG